MALQNELLEAFLAALEIAEVSSELEELSTT